MKVLYCIPGCVCLFLGVVFLLLYRHNHVRQEASERSLTSQAWAKLVDTESRLEYDYDNRRKTVYYGVYEFDSVEGHISSASNFGYCSPKDIPGARGNMVKILYNPRDPAEFALPEEQAVSATIWPKFKKTGILLTVLGLLFTAAAIAVLLGFFDPILDSLMNQA